MTVSTPEPAIALAIFTALLQTACPTPHKQAQVRMTNTSDDWKGHPVSSVRTYLGRRLNFEPVARHITYQYKRMLQAGHYLGTNRFNDLRACEVDYLYTYY
jgi:hypothetical protein